LERSRGVFWATSLGVIVLFTFIVAIGGVSLSDIAWLTAGVGVLTLLFVVHSIRVRRSLSHAGGRDESMRLLNALRERRGF
jgi:hypothetical protein